MKKDRVHLELKRYVIWQVIQNFSMGQYDTGKIVCGIGCYLAKAGILFYIEFVVAFINLLHWAKGFFAIYLSRILYSYFRIDRLIGHLF